jgi:hypothetical protein
MINGVRFFSESRDNNQMYRVYRSYTLTYNDLSPDMKEKLNGNEFIVITKREDDPRHHDPWNLDLHWQGYGERFATEEEARNFIKEERLRGNINIFVWE